MHYGLAALVLDKANYAISEHDKGFQGGYSGFAAIDFSNDPAGERLYIAIVGVLYEAYYATDENRLAAASKVLDGVAEPNLSTFQTALDALID